MKKNLEMGFTIFELLFVIVVVFFATTGIMQMNVFTLKTKNVGAERSKAVEYANRVMETYVAQEKNDPQSFWTGFSDNPSPAYGYDENNNSYVLYKKKENCAKTCGSLKVEVTMAVGGVKYAMERSFSSTPTITLTPTPTPICLTTGNACSLGGECCSGICLGGGLCQ